MDISTDNTLLISGSADKNIRLWGLDFGDCHKSIFAHDDSITAVKFVPETHYFWSVGKDSLVKYFDGDTYELISVFRSHFGGVWGLALNSLGDTIFTSGADRAIRRWIQTKEQLFIQDEETDRREQDMFDTIDAEFEGVFIIYIYIYISYII